MDVLINLLEKVTGQSADTLTPCGLSPLATAEYLFNTLSIFSDEYEKIKSLPFDPNFDWEATSAMAECAFTLSLTPMMNASAQAKRVLMERAVQIIQLSFGYDREVMTTLPCEIPEDHLMLCVCVYWLVSNTLPLKLIDQWPDEWPDTFQAASSSLSQ